jgi:hypothetical protein
MRTMRSFDVSRKVRRGDPREEPRRRFEQGDCLAPFGEAAREFETDEAAADQHRPARVHQQFA